MDNTHLDLPPEKVRNGWLCDNVSNPRQGSTMVVLVNGHHELRNVHYHRYHNGYRDLAFPVLFDGEFCHWNAGSRVPEILGHGRLSC